MRYKLRRIRNRLSGSDLTANLPERVQDTINARQDASEILIGWVQFAFIVTMAVLYAVSPKAFTEDTMFAPVPWAIVAYLAFTVTRLVLAYRRRLPRALLLVSVILDMTLLMGLIFTFHIQYQQPPSFYLKSPTLLYVFIFIAIRALRFDPAYVVLSGAVAALGWLALLAYAVAMAPESAGITRDYAEYLTSNRILLGAEFDKIISILTVTIVLWIGIGRAQSQLVEAVSEQSTGRELARFLPREIVDRVRRSSTRLEAGDCEASDATIMHIDIESFTRISERIAPTNLVAALNDYFAAVAEPIERHGGVICQFQGDAILASFNVPRVDPAHASSALAAAREILELVAKRGFGDDVVFDVRIGINSGRVVGGLVGTPTQVGYTVHGNDVNLAARLEQLNKDTGTRLLVSESTRRLAGENAAGLVPAGEFEIRGQSQKTRAYTLPARAIPGANGKRRTRESGR